MKTIDLTGKTAVITGASQGLGRAIAEQLHDAGANVVVNYARFENDKDRNQRQAEHVVVTLGDRATAVAADVRDSEAVATMFKQVEELYDLETDLGERNNLAAEYPEKVAELKALMDKIGPPNPNEN